MSGLQKADAADRPFAATATPDAMKFPMTTTEERHANEITARERGGVVRVGKAGRKTAGERGAGRDETAPTLRLAAQNQNAGAVAAAAMK